MKAAFEDTKIKRYIAIEKQKISRKICCAANPKTAVFPGVEHGLNSKNDIFKIAEEDIASLGKDAIEVICAGPMCNDFTRLRLLPDRPGWNGPPSGPGDPRPGLDGKYGQTVRKCIEIIGWVLKYNPNAKYFMENINFSDMKEDYAEVCSALGTPLVLDSYDHSCTKRIRAYWHNLSLPENFKQGYEHLEPNDFMTTGRTVQKHQSRGRMQCRTIGGSWEGDASSPTAATNVPVLVFDEQHDEPQHLHAEEAEGLMGMEAGTTAGEGITAIDRLRCIGAGWDIRVTSMVLKHVREDALTLHTMAHMASLEDTRTDEQLQQAQHLFLIQHQTPDQFTSMFNTVLSRDGEHEAAKIIAVSQHYRRQVLLTESKDSIIIDSGAGRHIDTRTRILDPDYRMRLTGFVGEESWTNGSGYLPLQLHDELSSTDFQVDIEDTDYLESAACNLLSMGKLLRKGWKFDLEWDALYAYTPSGERVLLQVTHDDVLRLPHSVREGESAEQLPINTVKAITKEGATYDFLHRLFNHANADKIHRTLGATKGFQQPERPLQSCRCDACALGNARSRGLRQHCTMHSVYTEESSPSARICTVQPGPMGDLPDLIFEFDDSDESSPDESDSSYTSVDTDIIDLQYVSEQLAEHGDFPLIYADDFDMPSAEYFKAATADHTAKAAPL